ncbi:hypothetical protein DNH61_01510 [Paenibacillus sambharensis]|uniref:Uncharacterized protein n=1 Tax=Paenibacillus sambharensis TaxID=1803190 RepID=A0A2W1LEQ3_9BACL|nr:hypothetical protein [Paenibacillus sambharensis]PZD97576.1 hypothetical protein DNH61_01510 [Paenibacillus sambharensis]
MMQPYTILAKRIHYDKWVEDPAVQLCGGESEEFQASAGRTAEVRIRRQGVIPKRDSAFLYSANWLNT